MTAQENVIELNKLSYKVGNNYLLRDIDWKVKQGEHWLVFGANGSGKTTLLSIIAGMQYYTDGYVKVLGESFNKENILKIRKCVGLVSVSYFEKYYTKESALNIVLSGLCGTLCVDGRITLKDIKKAKDLLQAVGLGKKADHTFDMFSKGERQNILIARALICNPSVLILDEPCTGLDMHNRSNLFSTIDKISQKDNLTIIYVTHYSEEILPMFQKALLLKNGRIFEKGKTEELFSSEILTNYFNVPVIADNATKLRSFTLQIESSLTDLL